MVREIERRKNHLILMIIFMVIVIFVMGLRVQDKLNNSVLVHNNLKDLVTFKASDTGFSYSLPYDWQYKEQYINKLDLAYYNSFTSNDNKISGNIEVRRYVGDILTDVNNGKRLSAEPINDDFSVIPRNSNSKSEIEVIYDTLGDNNITYRVKEYFIISDEAYIKFAFYVKDGEEDSSIDSLYDKLLQQVNINN